MSDAISAIRFQRSVKANTEARLIAGAGVLSQLADEASLCKFPNDDAREAVAYAIFCFLARMAEAHESAPQFTRIYANSFMDGVLAPLRQSADFLVRGGPTDEAVAIISAICRVDSKLSNQFPGY